VPRPTKAVPRNITVAGSGTGVRIWLVMTFIPEFAPSEKEIF
jgi:hypothetical protein